MIGLQRGPNNNQPNREDEPPEVRNLSKQQIYTQLSNDFFLPSYDSKGVNRAYLVGVYTNRYLRIPLMDWKRFELNLTPNQMKRNNLVNMTYILRKLNGILRERGMNPLGFPDFMVPEEDWVMKVARFIDRTNVMEFFTERLQEIREPDIESERVYRARERAYAYLFDNQNFINNPKIFNSLKDISECYRRIISKRIDVEELDMIRRSHLNKIAEEEGLLKSSLMKASATVIAMAREAFDPDEIYLGEGQDAVVQRHELGQVVHLYFEFT